MRFATAVIRKVSVVGGVVSLLAGVYGVTGSADGALGTARFGFTAGVGRNGVGIDARGKLYVAVRLVLFTLHGKQ